VLASGWLGGELLRFSRGIFDEFYLMVH
jgi:type III secretory pathway component EscS